jgi:hypothetical protein
MAGKSEKSMKLGEKIVLTGLFLQILFFGFFVVVSVIFDRRIQKSPTPQSVSPAIPWRKHLLTLYAASAFILVRSIFRVIEYLQGNNGYLLRNEFWLYIFDAVLMLAVMVIFNVVHPGEVKALLVGGKAARGVKMETLNEVPKTENLVRYTGTGSV